MAWWLWETLFGVLRFSQIIQGLSWGDEELCSLGEEAHKDTGTFWSSHLLLEGPGGLTSLGLWFLSYPETTDSLLPVMAMHSPFPCTMQAVRASVLSRAPGFCMALAWATGLPRVPFTPL